MTTERDRRCDAGAADNREQHRRRRTLEVANPASTGMTVMGKHANGRASLATSDETGRRGQTEHRNSSSVFELCGPPGAATYSGRRARSSWTAPQAREGDHGNLHCGHGRARLVHDRDGGPSSSSERREPARRRSTRH